MTQIHIFYVHPLNDVVVVMIRAALAEQKSQD